MIMPTFLLLNSIAQLGLPTALNILISSNKFNTKNLVFTAILISLSLKKSKTVICYHNLED